jgi:hypothetical protein
VETTERSLDSSATLYAPFAARRIPVALTIQDGDYVVVGGAGVDELADGRPELLLEHTAVPAQEVFVERQHDLGVEAAFLVITLLDSTRIPLASSDAGFLALDMTMWATSTTAKITTIEVSPIWIARLRLRSAASRS